MTLTLQMLAGLEIEAAEFHRRRAMARRSGSPAWLWPEISVADWAEACSQVTEAVAAVLAGERPSLPPIDPMVMSLACYTTGCGPLLGWWSEAGFLSASNDINALLSLHLNHARMRHERVFARSLEIVRKLKQNGVPAIVLKGAHTGHSYFPHPATRPSSDLDLLVPHDQRRTAEAVLSEAGYLTISRGQRESSWMQTRERREPRSLWMVHAADPWSVDLHNSLDFAASPGAALVRLDSADPCATRAPWPGGSGARVLEQPLLLLHLAVHASGGLHSLTLLRMIEIILVVRQDRANGRLSWDEFVLLAERTGGLGAAYPVFAMCEKLAPGTIPSDVLGRCARSAPKRARRIIENLEPANAHRVDRNSISEHFMWLTGPSGWIRQLVSDVAPCRGLWPIYQARAYRLLRGQLSR